MLLRNVAHKRAIIKLLRNKKLRILYFYCALTFHAKAATSSKPT